MLFHISIQKLYKFKLNKKKLYNKINCTNMCTIFFFLLSLCWLVGHVENLFSINRDKQIYCKELLVYSLCFSFWTKGKVLFLWSFWRIFTLRDIAISLIGRAQESSWEPREFHLSLNHLWSSVFLWFEDDHI